MLKRLKNMFGRLTLVQGYFLASFLIMVAGMAGIGLWTVQEIEQGVIHGTAMTTSLYIESFVEPKLLDLKNSQSLTDQSITELDDLLENTPLGDQIVVLKVWSLNGKVLYSNIHDSIGKTFPIEERLANSLNGEANTRISNLDSDENIAERSLGRLIETYSPMHVLGTNQVIGAVEFYQKMDDLQALINNAQFGSWAVVAGSMTLIYILLGLFVQRAGATIESQKAALNSQVNRLTELLQQNNELNERIRNAARSIASLNERIYRRIGSEIHDGPAQALSLALLKLDNILALSDASHQAYHNHLAAPVSLKSASEMLIDIQENLSQTMQELRSISSGLSVPHLEELTLVETIKKPMQTHERKTGTHVDLELGTLPLQAPLPIKITVYRLVQEALNNSFRHAGGIGQAVKATALDNELMIEISDRGPGFEVEKSRASEGHLGLAGMRERVEALGGIFKIESKAGQGTSINARLSLSSEGIDA